MRTLLLCMFSVIVANYFEETWSHVIDDCTLGESYWCSSESNAKRCRKMEECFPTREKNDYIKMKPITDIPLESENVKGIRHNPFGSYIG